MSHLVQAGELPVTPEPVMYPSSCKTPPLFLSIAYVVNGPQILITRHTFVKITFEDARLHMLKGYFCNIDQIRFYFDSHVVYFSLLDI